MNLNDREERQIAAADYVFGRLDAAERAAFDERLQSDASLRVIVDEWRVRLRDARQEQAAAPSASTADPTAERPEGPAVADTPGLPQAPAPRASREEAVEANSVLLVQLQRRVEIWRMLAFAGAVTAAGFGFFLFARSPLWQPGDERTIPFAGAGAEAGAETAEPVIETIQPLPAPAQSAESK